MSTKGTYGLRAVLDIAEHAADDGAVSNRAISDRTGITEGYLMQILRSLRSAGIIDSVRGVKGGYVLLKSPDELSVADVLRAVGESIEPVECVTASSGSDCAEAGCCRAHGAWKRLNDGIVDILDGLTIASLLQEVPEETAESK